jgi:hypothetical protein
MARLHGSKNRKTLLREAEEVLEHSRAPHEIADSVHVMETVMMHFFNQALSKKHWGKPEAEVTAAMKDALMAAERVAPFRHPKLAAMKLAGDPSNPLRMMDNATAEELKAEIMRHLRILAPVLDLEPLIALADGSATPDARQDAAGNDARPPHHVKKRSGRHGNRCLAGASTGS